MVESIYGTRRPAMERVQARVVQELAAANAREKLYEHVITRIKSEDSMREKCARRGLKPTPESALSEIRDAIGIRVVTGFIEDIHRVVEVLRALPGVQIVEEKDYVYNAKPNGYRSYHAILAVRDPGASDGHDEPDEDASYYVEVQVRTIAMDSWAALEHQMKYKKGIANQDRIAAELKRCADELASCDMSMQTIRHLINGD